MERPTKKRAITITPSRLSKIHIQLPQQVTDSYKLVYISHQARGDSDSGEHSPADSQGIDTHPGLALRKACSLEHLDVKAVGGPESRKHSPVKHSGTTLPGPTRSLKDSIAHKDNPVCGGTDSRNCSAAKPFRDVDSSIAHSDSHRIAHKDIPACGGPDSRDRSAAHPGGLTNPSDLTEGDLPKQKGDHPPRTPPRPTPQVKPQRLESRLTPLQKRRLKTLKKKGRPQKQHIPHPTPKISPVKNCLI